MNGQQSKSAIELLKDAATELAQIRRAKHYGRWRQETAPRLGDALAQVEPFNDFGLVWFNTGDGGGLLTKPRFGEWAIDLLLDKKTPESILARFSAEVERNAAVYNEISPVFGIQVDKYCDLGDGIALVPEPEDQLARLLHYSLFEARQIPKRTSLLKQSFTVTPAFERGKGEETPQGGPYTTAPEASYRNEMRQRLRLACLLASNGPVELPLTVLSPDQDALFVSREGMSWAREFSARPLASVPVGAVEVKRSLNLLGAFRELESIARAIDRLGRARLAVSRVDRALELGIAAEILLMHDHSPANTEITHKIGSRAAWLLGRDPAEREAIFRDIKKLYHARSQAVHSGTLSSKSTIDLDAADRLVARALFAIVERGGFPNWNSLTMGGNE